VLTAERDLNLPSVTAVDSDLKNRASRLWGIFLYSHRPPGSAKKRAVSSQKKTRKVTDSRRAFEGVRKHDGQSAMLESSLMSDRGESGFGRSAQPPTPAESHVIGAETARRGGPCENGPFSVRGSQSESV
jgi:hypothetical protein